MKYPQLSSKDIVKYLKNNIEPIEDNSYGQGYRASVYLRDGTYLPCVVFRSSSKIVKLAIRRFKEEKKAKGFFNKISGMGYYNIVKSFVTTGNCLNEYDIAKLRKVHMLSNTNFKANTRRNDYGLD